MSLSENEQRILRQIEAELQNDERFAQAVSPAGLYTHSVRTVRLAIVGLVACLALLVVGLFLHYVVAFAVFVVMLFLLGVIERNARAMGKAGLQDVAGAIRKMRNGGSDR
jgi:Flp pilus assembly protein TadB